MKKEEQKVDFDLSKLKLDELIKVYKDIDGFIQFLDTKKVTIEKKGKGDNE